MLDLAVQYIKDLQSQVQVCTKLSTDEHSSTPFYFEKVILTNIKCEIWPIECMSCRKP